MNEVGMVQTRTGLKLFHSFPPGEKIFGIVNYRDVIIIATSEGLYRIADADDEVAMTVQKIEILSI